MKVQTKKSDVRIVGGQFKGRKISAPKGDVSRPTTDRTRESLFNILTARENFSFTQARVIDLFAGSGALGFEALSRGAAFTLFVETDAGARGAIRDNIEALGLFGQTRIHRRSATRLGSKSASSGDPFSIAFLDPPYRKALATDALVELRNGGWLSPDALIILEQAKDEAPVLASGFEQVDQRIYGDTQVSFFNFRP